MSSASAAFNLSHAKMLFCGEESNQISVNWSNDPELLEETCFDVYKMVYFPLKTNVNQTFSVKREIDAFAKSINSCKSEQADTGSFFSAPPGWFSGERV